MAYREQATILSIQVGKQTSDRLEALAGLAKTTVEALLQQALAQGLPEVEAQVHQRAARAIGRCPRCGREGIPSRDAGGVLLQACGGCGGIWLDLASAERFLGAPEREAVELARRVAQNAKTPVEHDRPCACPVCAAPLEQHLMKVAGVSVDRCDRHGTWFDRDELEQLGVAIARARQQRAELEALDQDLQLQQELADLERIYAAGRAAGGDQTVWRNDGFLKRW